MPVEVYLSSFHSSEKIQMICIIPRTDHFYNYFFFFFETLILYCKFVVNDSIQNTILADFSEVSYNQFRFSENAILRYMFNKKFLIFN